MASLVAIRLMGEAEETPLPQPSSSGQRYNFSRQFLQSITQKALEPHIRIRFLDGDKEEIYIRLIQIPNAYYQGSSEHPGYVPEPTPRQLRQIGGPIGKTSGGEFAMEVLNCNRYEGYSVKGRMKMSREDAQETPDLYYRPFEYEYVNDEDLRDDLSS